MSGKLTNNDFYKQIAELLHSARQQVVRTVNQTMVLTYFEIGRQIVGRRTTGKRAGRIR